MRLPLVIITALLCAWTASAQVDVPALNFVSVLTNQFASPTCIAHAADGSGRLFVVEQNGVIRIVQSNSTPAQAFLNITDRVLRGSEQGLLGLAFPPGFVTNRHFYVNYIRPLDGATVISRFSVTGDANLADPNSEQIIKTIAQLSFNHKGGQLAFGPDGFLYIGMGDGGYQLPSSPLGGDPRNLAQNPRFLLGKLLRIDVESGVSPFSIPASNPFVGNTNYAPEIWALGLRNPWRFSFDRATGDLYIGDVGHDNWEEIDFQPAGSLGGQNYGWRIMEGPTNYIVPAGFTNFSQLTMPVASYHHFSVLSDGGASVIGGYVYRGPHEPRLDGKYLFGDFASGQIWGLTREGTNWLRFEVARSGFNISTFGEDDEGRLYLADYFKGRIYQIQDSRQVWKPTFSPEVSVLNSNAVIVGCASINATIHFTTTGVDPTEFDPVVPPSGIIQVSNRATNKARAFRVDLTPSQVASATFTLKVGTPTLTPPNGRITNNTVVVIATVTPGSTIFYTTNGAVPTTNSAVYSGPFRINGDTPLKAFAVANGYDDSSVVSVFYPLAIVATPVITPASAIITNGTTISVSISCSTLGAVIHYTLDGTTPDTNSLIYSEPISLSSPTTVSTRAFSSGWAPSGAASVFYGLLDFQNTIVSTVAGGAKLGLSNSVGKLAQFSSPSGVCIDRSGALYVADTGNHVIRKILLASGETSTFAGDGAADFQDGYRTNAQFAAPVSVALDSAGNLFVADDGCGVWHLRRIDTNGIVTTVLTVSGVGCSTLWQMEVDPGGTAYLGARGLGSLKISPDGAVQALTGDAGGIGIDALTNIYIAAERTVLRIKPDEAQEMFAGGGDVAFSDGPRLKSRFESAMAAAVDGATNVIISEVARIRRIGADGWVSTVAGTGIPGYRNGRGSVAQFNVATGLCVDTNGNIYVADRENHCIRKISSDSASIGIADDWQRMHFGYVGIDPNADPDHDGMSNYAEFWAGTDPLDSGSVLIIKSVSLLVDGYTQITWQSVPGKSYTVRYSSDLNTWNDLGDSVQGDGSILSSTDPTPVGQMANRIYRVFIDF